MSINRQEHWDRAFTKNLTEKLGWYEPTSQQTLDLIQKIALPKDSKILNVGNGSSTLIDDLLVLGYTNLIGTDISSKALATAKQRLGEGADRVEFIEDDLTNPTRLNLLEKIDLWNDRAVLHFFLSKKEIKSYFDLLKKILNTNGYVIIAAFSLNGHDKCCGLDLQRYDAKMIHENLGDEFELIETFDYTFINPYGSERPYVYTLFQRVNSLRS